MKFLFVGEKPSETAYKKGWTWRDGALAAKSLFDAMEANGMNPLEHSYVNLFGDTPDAPLTLTEEVKKRFWDRLASHPSGYGVIIVALGKRVSKGLADMQIMHLQLVHPAARGHIRKKERYAKHVKEVLLQGHWGEAWLKGGPMEPALHSCGCGKGEVCRPNAPRGRSKHACGCIGKELCYPERLAK